MPNMNLSKGGTCWINVAASFISNWSRSVAYVRNDSNPIYRIEEPSKFSLSYDDECKKEHAASSSSTDAFAVSKDDLTQQQQAATSAENAVQSKKRIEAHTTENAAAAETVKKEVEEEISKNEDAIENELEQAEGESKKKESAAAVLSEEERVRKDQEAKLENEKPGAVGKEKVTDGIGKGEVKDEPNDPPKEDELEDTPIYSHQ